MLIVITSISFLVHMYAIEYMRGDPFVARFMAYLSLFTWFMIILVTADNLVQLFVGWEGVGLVSYLLINFWFTIPEANKSALKAMVVNRVGDLGLAIAIAITYKLFKSIKFTVFLPLVPFFFKGSNYFFWIFFFYYRNNCYFNFCRCSWKICSIRFTYLIAWCDGRANSSFCFNSCRNHGYSGCFYSIKNCPFTWVRKMCLDYNYCNRCSNCFFFSNNWIFSVWFKKNNCVFNL